MKTLQKLYRQNSIVQFFVSYFLVLILPLLLCMGGFQIAFTVVEEEIEKNTLAMLDNSRQLIDTQIQSIQSMCMQLSRNAGILAVASEDGRDNPQLHLQAVAGIEALSKTQGFQSAALLQDVYLYLPGGDYIMTREALYDASFYYLYILKADPALYEAWKAQFYRDAQAQASYVWDGQEIAYLYPVQIGFGQAARQRATIACRLNTQQLKRLLGYTGEDAGSYVFIQDRDEQLLFDVNDGYRRVVGGKKQQVKSADKDIVLTTQSSLTAWRYTSGMPRQRVMARLDQFKQIVMALLSVAAVGGVGLSYVMSVRKGKPINELFTEVRQTLIHDGEEEPGDINGLDGVVSRILSSNRLLQEQIDQDRPFALRLFMQRLVRGEFVDETELRLRAEQFSLPVDGRYMVVAFCVYPNDDYSLSDSQTMQAITVITHLIQGKLREHLQREIWFYETDGSTTYAVIGLTQDAGEIERAVQRVHEGVLQGYSVAPSWGMGEPCESLSVLWRGCEQARGALEYAIRGSSVGLVKYREVEHDRLNYYYPQILERRLISHIKAGALPGIEALIGIIRMENMQKRSLSEAMFAKLHHDLMVTILRLLGDKAPPQDVEALDVVSQRMSPEAENTYFTLLLNVCLQLSQEFQQEKSESQSGLVTRMQEYIQSIYMDPSLGLAMVAVQFHISEGYVSSIFKDKLGINFTDYVENLRIDKACELLREPEITIQEIAGRVGYNSVQSFRRAFKRVKGVSPKEMRE